MSRYVASLVYRKKVGSMARKSILAYCAERANDDGSGVWPAKSTVAKEVECSKQTVIDTFRAFANEGLLIEVGRRKTSNGFVVMYDMSIAAIRALPDAISDEELTGPILDGSNELTPRGQATGPQEVKPVDPNRPLTVLKPSNSARDEPDLFSDKLSPTEEVKPKASIEEKFKEFWKVFPKKIAPDKSRRNFERAVKSGVDPDLIISAARRYAQSDAVQRGFVKHPQGWLTDERWNDSPPEEDLSPAELRIRALKAAAG